MNGEIQNMETESEDSKDVNIRQQDKIIAFVTGKTDKVDNRFEYVSENEREQFYSDLQDGKYDNEDFDKMLKEIEPPISRKKGLEKSH